MDKYETPEPYLIWNEEKRADGAQARAMFLSKPDVVRWVKRGAAILIALIALPPIPMVLGILWLLSLLTGYVAVLLIALLFLLPLRKVLAWPQTRISVPTHQKLAEWALVLSLLHVALLLCIDPLTIEYLKPTQPFFMWAGNAGAVVLAVLWGTSLERLRTRFFGPRFRFRTIHVAGSVIAVVLVFLHVVGSGAFISGPVKTAVLAIIASLLVAQTLKPAVRPERDSAGIPPQERE